MCRRGNRGILWYSVLYRVITRRGRVCAWRVRSRIRFAQGFGFGLVGDRAGPA